MVYESIIAAIIDAYEGDDPWAYEDELRTTINDFDKEAANADNERSDDR